MSSNNKNKNRRKSMTYNKFLEKTLDHIKPEPKRKTHKELVEEINKNRGSN